MGLHWDNYSVDAINCMMEGKNPMTVTTRNGIKNSQVHGTSTIIFTLGNCPMNIVFGYPNLAKGGLRQKVSKYVSSSSFKCEMAPGYITVIDMLDDLRMCHGVTFKAVEVEGVPKEL